MDNKVLCEHDSAILNNIFDPDLPFGDVEPKIEIKKDGSLFRSSLSFTKTSLKIQY